MRRSTLHIVDLAGSERLCKTKAEGKGFNEGVYINQSLLVLSKVIGALVENAAHVPYRECALTRVLKDSLGGNSRTVLIANVRAVREHIDETLQTLRYADKAKQIKNTPIRSENLEIR